MTMKWLSGLFEYLHEQLEQCPCTTTLHFTIVTTMIILDLTKLYGYVVNVI